MGKSKNEVIFDVPVKTIHGKPGKDVDGYYRHHYGKQRFVRTKKYEDYPTENQIASRRAFGELRRRVAQEIHDPIKGPWWRQQFNEEKLRQGDKFSYSLLAGFVYAELKNGQVRP